MFKELTRFLNKPPLYAPGTNQFWNDEHISQFILASHLNPSEEAASRNPRFMDESAAWITSVAPPVQYQMLLDLGCGPGLYAERFAGLGYSVTGIDFSKRSIEYAREQTAIQKSDISYLYQDYLTIEYNGRFDVITLIYCDFGVLSAAGRASLMNRVCKGLRPGGKFILDVFTPVQNKGKPETRDWQYNPNGGFWDAGPHLCLNAFYRYDDDNTVLNQTIVVGERGLECYNIWEHNFTKEALITEARVAGFHRYELYGDVSGRPYDDEASVICVVFTRS